MDVEGWEDRALLGALETIARFKVISPTNATIIIGAIAIILSLQPALFFEAETSSSADFLPYNSTFVKQHLQPLGYSCR
jgi:hypothetical protein